MSMRAIVPKLGPGEVSYRVNYTKTIGAGVVHGVTFVVACTELEARAAFIAAHPTSRITDCSPAVL